MSSSMQFGLESDTATDFNFHHGYFSNGQVDNNIQNNLSMTSEGEGYTTSTTGLHPPVYIPPSENWCTSYPEVLPPVPVSSPPVDLDSLPVTVSQVQPPKIIGENSHDWLNLVRKISYQRTKSGNESKLLDM